jgi:hypothetical protein
MRPTKRNYIDPGQTEFGMARRLARYPFRLRAGDVVRLYNRLGQIIRVTECAAVVLMNRPPREFTTRFDRHVRFQPKPALFRISANSECEILNRKIK